MTAEQTTYGYGSRKVIGPDGRVARVRMTEAEISRNWSTEPMANGRLGAEVWDTDGLISLVEVEIVASIRDFAPDDPIRNPLRRYPMHNGDDAS